VLKAIGRLFGLVPVADIEAATYEAARTISQQSALRPFTAWQYMNEPLSRRGVTVTWLGPQSETHPGDMRKP